MKDKFPFRVALVTSTDPNNRRSWSGVHFSILQALNNHVEQVDVIGPVPLRLPFAVGERLNRWFFDRILGRRYHYSWGVFVSLMYSIIISGRIRKAKPDIIIAPAALTEIAFLRTKVPILYISDCTLSQIIDFYPGLSNLLEISKAELLYVERRALAKVFHASFSSEWAATSAKSLNGLSEENVSVIPFGANFPEPPSNSAASLGPALDGETCQLLLVGSDWYRKGGDIAYDTVAALRELGVKAKLTVVGCAPPDGSYTIDNDIELIPYLNMGIERDREKLAELFGAAHFFIMPSRAECAAIAFCDANSFGVPVLTTDVGGISSFIEQGVNGFMLPRGSDGSAFARKILNLMASPASYAQLRASSRVSYEKTLNWNVWCRTLLNKIEAELLGLSPRNAL